MERESHYDVAIVGASIAGCTAAALYGRSGLRVALIDKQPTANGFKRMCTHYIQGCATPTIQRLGIASDIEACGGLRNTVHVWTRYGWIRSYGDKPTPYYGYNIRRKQLDPIVRKAAVDNQHVSYLPGYGVKELLHHNGRVIGVAVHNGRGERKQIYARLTIGADGRYSAVARLAKANARVIPNNRVFFITYYANLPLATGEISQLWFLDPDIAYAFPCDNGLTLLCAGIDTRRVHDFQRGLKYQFHAFCKRLPDGPTMDAGTPIGNIIMGKQMHTIFRSHHEQGLALVGDALLAADPYPGVGIGWAFQGAEWLVDITTDSLIRGRAHSIDQDVKRFERVHRARIGGHARVIASYSSCRPFRALVPPEKLLFHAATRDERIARQLDAYLNRVIAVSELLSPSILVRAMWIMIKSLWNRDHTDKRTTEGLRVHNNVSP